ncbi:MAG: KH domain-containing protein [Spirochaetes bacterium]|nr:KH domain-containing protein [Spirochaetota bacterium]
MLVKEFSGKNEKEALKAALEELALTEADIRVELLDKGKRSILGIGEDVPARIRVFYEEINTKMNSVRDIVEGIVKNMNFTATVTATEEAEKKIYINIESENSAILIGKKGATLEALQFIVSLIVSKKFGLDEEHHVVIDIDGYRKRREDALRQMAERVADTVKRTHRSKMLEPMNPYERRVIHVTLQGDTEVETKSEGEGTIKQVCIIPKGGSRGGYQNNSRGGGRRPYGDRSNNRGRRPYGDRSGGGRRTGGGSSFGGGGDNYRDRGDEIPPDNIGNSIQDDKEILPPDDIGNRIDRR